MYLLGLSLANTDEEEPSVVAMWLSQSSVQMDRVQGMIDMSLKMGIVTRF